MRRPEAGRMRRMRLKVPTRGDVKWPPLAPAATGSRERRKAPPPQKKKEKKKKKKKKREEKVCGLSSQRSLSSAAPPTARDRRQPRPPQPDRYLPVCFSRLSH